MPSVLSTDSILEALPRKRHIAAVVPFRFQGLCSCEHVLYPVLFTSSSSSLTCISRESACTAEARWGTVSRAGAWRRRQRGPASGARKEDRPRPRSPRCNGGDSFSLPGLAVRNLCMRVPLAHEQPEGEQITVFARMVSQDERTAKPILLFLQGSLPPT